MADPEAKVKISAVDKTRQAFQSAENNMNRFRSTAAKLGTVLTAGALASAVRTSLEFADSIDKAAKAAAVSTGFLQEMRFAGDQLGVTQTQVDEGFRRFTRRLGEFANSGAGPAAKAFEQLGIEVKDGQGKLRSSESVFGDVAKAMEQVGDQARISALAAQLFGDDAGPKLALLLNQGVDGLNNLRQEAKDIGAVLGEDVIANATEARDELGKLSKVLKVQFTAAIVTVGPLLTKFASATLETARALSIFFDSLRPLSEQRSLDQLENSYQKKLIAILDIRRQIDTVASHGGDPGQLKTRLERLNTEADAIKARYDVLKALRDGLKNLDSDNTPWKIPTVNLQTNEEIAAAKREQIRLDREAEQAIAAVEKEIEDVYAASDRWVESINNSAQALREATYPSEALKTELADINDLLDFGKINWATYSDAVVDAELRYRDAFDKVDEKAKEVSDDALQVGDSFGAAFEKAIIGGEKFSDVLQGLLKDIAQIAIRRIATQPIERGISTGLTALGFASGGSFTVGGSGGTDSKYVGFWATPGEEVTVRTPAQQRAGGGGNTYNFDFRGADPGVEVRVRAMLRQFQAQTKAEIFRDIERGGAAARAVGRTA